MVVRGHLMEWKPRDLKELAEIAQKYLTAHSKKMSTPAPYPKKNLSIPDTRITSLSSAADGGLKCFNWGALGHKTSDCFSRAQDRRI